MEKRILLVEDDEPLQLLLTEMLSTHAYTAITASNGQEGVDLYKKSQFEVVITDLQMPVMDGREFIEKLKSINENVIIIVATVQNNAQVIIDIMKMGIYDYIIKPVKGDEIAFTLQRAFEAAELRRIKKVLEKEKTTKLQNQLEWFQYTEKFLKKDSISFNKAFFESMHNSFTMGAGLGTVLTLLKIIKETAEKKDDKYIIDSELFEVVEKNAALAENAIMVFSKINKIIKDKVVLQKISIFDLHKSLMLFIKEMDKYTKIKKHKIIISDPRELFKNIYAKINLEYIKEAFKELLLNALKFSIPDSTILVILEPLGKEVQMSIINNPLNYENNIAGIPEEYENIVFEPFYRVSKTVFPGYDSLDCGLGLSLVEKIVEKHNGKVSAANIDDYSLLIKGPVEKVNVSLRIPVME